MSLDEVYDATEDASAELLRRGVDVRAYVILVDRLAVRLGGGDAHARAAQLLYAHFLDTPPEKVEAPPSWFEAWLEEDEVRTLTNNVTKGLSEIVRSVARANATHDCAFLDEGFAYDCNVDMLNDVVENCMKRLAR